MVRPVGSGEVAARAPVLPARPARTPADALSDLQIRADSGLAEILVRVGMLRREDGRVRSVRLHGLRLELVPADGGAIAAGRGDQAGLGVAGGDLPLPRGAPACVGGRRRRRHLPGEGHGHRAGRTRPCAARAGPSPWTDAARPPRVWPIEP